MAKAHSVKLDERPDSTKRGILSALEQAMDDESDAEIIVDGELDKDETEEELERLVFGDSAAFREGLKDFTLEEYHEHEDEGEHDGDATTSGLEGLDDAQVGRGRHSMHSTLSDTNLLAILHRYWR
jgi:hypothetical protein